jgi:hypothetical protein
MATFTFGRAVDIHWQGYEVVGPAGTVFSIPDQLYDEFNDDIAPVEPTLVWVDTNEFLTLSNSVSVTTLTGTIPISVTSTTSGKVVAISSTTNPAGYNLVADGTGGVIFQAGSTGALTSVVGVSPISAIVSGNTVSVSLNANYQTAGSYQPSGTYVTGVVGTSPISATGTTAITVGIDQSAITAGNALSAQATVYLVRNNTASTILKGTLVSATGAEPSGRIDIAPFSVTGLQDSELRVMGIATENIGAGVNGIVMSFGTLTGLDTRGTEASALAVGDEDWDEGTILYAHPTVPGKLTEVRPQHDLAVAFTTVRHGSTGQIAIRIVPGNFHLEWLHDVFTTGVSTSLPLVYNAASSGWVAQALTSVGIASGAIGSAQIAAGAVDSAALASNAVVAAKIAAAAVGTSAINSGAATTGQVLTADGAGAATFTTISASPVSYSAQSITLNTWSYNTRILQAVTTANVTGDPTIVADPTSSTVFRIHDGSATSTIIKINASANTVIATYSPTLNTSERLRDAAWGNGKICVTTSGGGFQRWLIIDPATGSTLASGNIQGTGASSSEYPRVDYDTETQDFNIIVSSTYTAAPTTRPVARFVSSNTYTTKVHNFSIGTLVQAGATVSVAFTGRAIGVPRWITAASRYVMMHRYPTSTTNGTGQLVFLSASTATSDHLTITGRQYIGTEPNTSAQGYANRIIFAPSQSAMFYPVASSSGQVSGVTAGMRKIVFSNISSSYNTVGTTISFTAHTAPTVTPTSNLENNVLTNGSGTILPGQSGQNVIGFTDNNGVFFVQFAWWALFDEWLYRYGSTDSGSYGSLFRGATFTTNTNENLQSGFAAGGTTGIAAGIDGGNTYIYMYRAEGVAVEYAITGTRVGDIARPYSIFPSSTNGGVSNYIGASASTAVFAIRPLASSGAYAIVASAATAGTAASYAVEPSTVFKVGITQSPLTNALAGSLTLKSWSVK